MEYDNAEQQDKHENDEYEDIEFAEELEENENIVLQRMLFSIKEEGQRIRHVVL